MNYYLLAATALGLTSCLNVGPDTCNSTVLASVTTATGPKTVAVNSPAVYTLIYAPPSGCGTLAPFAQQTSGNTQTVGVNVNFSTCTCASPAVPGQATYTFQPTQAGTYYLKFMASTGYITDTLVAK